jgi:hypothetical protein
VEEMMSAMATRSPSVPRTSSGDARLDSMTSSDRDSSLEWMQQRRPQSTRAAEDLAAARVEAMMAALSNSRPEAVDYDEGEI